MSTTVWIKAAATALAFAIAFPALAGEGTMTINFGALAKGTATTISEGHVFWSGSFSGSVFDQSGDGPVHHAFVTCPGTNDLDFVANTSTLSGYCVISDGDKSRIVVTWQCAGAPGSCEGTAKWSQATGKWEGMTADVAFTAQLGPTLEDGSVPTYAIWTVSYKTP